MPTRTLEIIDWVRTKVLPDALYLQSFGTNIKKLISFKAKKQATTTLFYSRVISGDVTLENEDGLHIIESVDIKIHPETRFIKSAAKIDSQFHNEILFYTEIIPLFRKYDTHDFLSACVPTFVYGNATNGQKPEEDVIILKSLHKKGFRMDKGLFFDNSHIKLVLDRVAKYHALCYKCLGEERQRFQAIFSKVQKIFYDDPTFLSPYSANLLLFRGLEPLKNDPAYRDRLGDIYKHCERGTAWLRECLQSSDPLNVLAHSELMRQNLMFRYGSDGQPEEVVLLEWGMMKYASPITDVSTLLVMHTSPEVKRLHWDEFLKTYHNALSQQLCKGHPAKITLEDFELAVRKKGVYGYHCSVYILPSELETGIKEYLELLHSESRIRFWMEFGGAKATEYLAEIVKHMLDRNFSFSH